jgi:hypothetical protein
MDKIVNGYPIFINTFFENVLCYTSPPGPPPPPPVCFPPDELAHEAVEEARIGSCRMIRFFRMIGLNGFFRIKLFEGSSFRHLIRSFAIRQR